MILSVCSSPVTKVTAPQPRAAVVTAYLLPDARRPRGERTPHTGAWFPTEPDYGVMVPEPFTVRTVVAPSAVAAVSSANTVAVAPDTVRA